MGVVKTSVRGMLNANNTPFNVIEEDKAKKRGYVNSGTLVAGNCRIEHHPTFAEFIAGGLELNLVVAIDFTGSNGDPHSPGTLHYLDPSGRLLNQYEDAINVSIHYR
jgi:hypothetical protein